MTTTPIESWEKEFDEKFGKFSVNLNKKPLTSIELKDLIRTKLDEQRQQLIQEAVECVPAKREAPPSNDIPFDWGVEDEGDSRERKGWNACREEMLSKLSNLK